MYGVSHLCSEHKLCSRTVPTVRNGRGHVVPVRVTRREDWSRGGLLTNNDLQH